MSISATDMNKRRMKFETVNCLFITVLLIIFNYIYTRFSFGEFSLHMRYMFIFPLVFGTFIPTVFLITDKCDSVSRLVFNLWNAGIGTHVAGCTVQGIINISGRHTLYGVIYFVLGTVMLLAAVIVFAVRNLAKSC